MPLFDVRKKAFTAFGIWDLLTAKFTSKNYYLILKRINCEHDNWRILFFLPFLLFPVSHGVGAYPTNPVIPQNTNLNAHDTEKANKIVVIPKNVKDLRQNPGSSDLDIFTYEEMKLSTKHFRPDKVLGEGGFGIVYKGVIDEHVRPGYKTTNVAIKELDPEGLQGDREWLVGFQLIDY